MNKRQLIVDQANQTDLSTLRRNLVSILDCIQKSPPGEQLAAVAVSFQLLNEVLQQNPMETLQRAKNIIRQAEEERHPEVGGMRQYYEEMIGEKLR